MQGIRYGIGYNASVNRWQITELGQEPFASPRDTFEADVNLGEAYVQIVYPVRREFLKENRIEKVKYYEGEYPVIYFPFENNRVDFTTFKHKPHILSINGLTHLSVPEAGEYPFELYTCGGMKLWINKEELVTFAPYTRNIPGKKLVNLPLKKGVNEIAVYADELAERDVFFYFEMRYKGDRELEGIAYPDIDAAEAENAEQFLRSCYFPRDFITEGRLLLKADSSLLDKEIKISVSCEEAFTKRNSIRPGEEMEITVDRDTTEIDLGEVKDCNIGIFKIYVLCRLGKFSVRRDLLLAIMPGEAVNITPAAALSQRKKQALDFICDHGENVVITAMAILEQKKEMTLRAMECLDMSLRKIEAKEDCADFYLPPMLLLITRYRGYLSDGLYERIEKSILDFRYWIDEPGNDVMWYFSENHALLFHIGQYIAGYLYPDRIFAASGRTGRQQYEIGRERIARWFETFEKYGYAEWNSATYIPVDLIGFFVLNMMAPDKNVRDCAKRTLDFTFRLFACNSHAGVMASSYGRAYEETLKGIRLAEPNFLSWITCGKGYVTFASRAVTLYCLSDYAPEEYDTDRITDSNGWMTAELDQGVNKVKTSFYKTNDYFMACVRRFKPFVHGHQQHLMNIAVGSKGAQYYINHPGERLFSGGNRPAYWAGNGTMPFIEQYKNIMLLLYKIEPEELVHYIHAYSPFYEYDEYAMDGNWLFIRAENAYLGTYFSNGFEIVTDEANTGKEVISCGLNHGIIIKCGSDKEFGSFHSFKDIMRKAEIRYDKDEYLSFNDPQYGLIEIAGINHVTVNQSEIEYKDAHTLQVEKGVIRRRRN
jgi:hypothetical protein